MIALAQINPTVGAFEGNKKLILNAMSDAKQAGANLVIFPELAITGYPPLDLLERKAFIDRAMEVLDEIRAASDGLGVILGVPMANPDASGKPLFNSAVMLWDGKVIGIHHKVLLPTYDVFDEARYFEPGTGVTVVDTQMGRIGLTVCEDIWNDAGALGRKLYHADPVSSMPDGLDLLVNISASPFEHGKLSTRLKLARRAVDMAGCPLVYVNQIGGNDGLIFDGRSFVMTRDGNIAASARAFEQDLVLVADPNSADPTAMPVEQGDTELIDALALGMRDYVEKTGFRKVCLGLSGGIDSAVVAAIAVHGLGPDRVVAVSMPSRYSSTGTQSDARKLAQNLGVEFHEIPIEGPFSAFLDVLTPHFNGLPPDVTEENLQSRTRGAILMALSNKFGYLVLNTGNKSELAVGYCTLYGDMVGGLAVIGDLPKHKVYAVARAFNRDREIIPETIITRPPSAELRPDQKDTDSLPDYDVLDRVVSLYLEQGLDAREIKARGIDPAVVDRIVHLMRLAEYKRRQAPMALKVTAKAFGPGRVFPIVQRFEG